MFYNEYFIRLISIHSTLFDYICTTISYDLKITNNLIFVGCHLYNPETQYFTTPPEIVLYYYCFTYLKLSPHNETSE